MITGEGTIGVFELATPAVVHELGRVLHVANGNGNSVSASDAESFRDYPIGVRFTVVVGDTDQLIIDAARVRKVQYLFTEALKQLRFEPMIGQMRSPEAQRRYWHRQCQRLDLARTALGFASGLAHWETRHQRAFLTQIITVVQVIDWFDAIVQASLLHAFEPKHFGVEVIVFLSTADVEGDVVMALDMRIEFHDGLFLMVVKVAQVIEYGMADYGRRPSRALVSKVRMPSASIGRGFQ
ncbi:hypothetical protein D3C77_280810 [compost metagenome]